MVILANLISYIFHPLFLSIYGFLLVFLLNPYLAKGVPVKQLTLLIAGFTALFPLLSILVAKKLGFVKTLEMTDRKERIIPLLITGFFYFNTYLLLKNHPQMPAVYSTILLGMTFAVYAAFFLNVFIKLSLHALASAALVSIIIYFNHYAVFDLFGIICLLIIIAGIVATARLILKAHRPVEIYTGLLAGLIAPLPAFIFF